MKNTWPGTSVIVMMTSAVDDFLSNRMKVYSSMRSKHCNLPMDEVYAPQEGLY